MKTVLAVVGGLVLLGLGGLYAFGWAVQKGWISDPTQKSTQGSGGKSSSQTSTPVSEGVFLGQGDDPVDNPGLTGCTYSYNDVERMFVKDNQGARSYSGQLRVWLKADCPSGAALKVGGGRPGQWGSGTWVGDTANFHVREARLWVDCNNERVWTEFERYTEGGKTVHEAQPTTTLLGDSTVLEGQALENDRPGKIIPPNSLLTPFTDKYCPSAQSGKPVK